MLERLESGLQNRARGFESHPGLTGASSTLSQSEIWPCQTIRILKMRKTALAILAFLFFSLASFRTAFAQEVSFDQAYQDYVQAETGYSRADADYQLTKGFYLKNPTLTLREDARKKTLVALRARDELIKTYLKMLRTKMVSLDRLSTDELATALGRIDPEITWYEAHLNSYQDSDSLEDLFNKSKEAESRYKTATSVVIYDAFFYISLGEVVALRSSHEEVYTSIKETLNQNVSEGKIAADPFDKWLKDIDAVLFSLKINEGLVRKQEEKLFHEGINPANTYPSVVEPFLHSTALLKQLNSYLTEFFTALNTQIK